MSKIPAKFDPRREAALRIVETSRLLRSLVEQRLRPFGMSRVQFACLSKLELNDGLVQTELAEMLEVQPIAMVRLADQLAADGLIVRRPDPEDRRCNRLHITAKGRETIARMADFKDQLGAEVFRGIAKDDVDQLLNTLNTLHGNVKAILLEEASVARTKKAVNQ